MVLRDFLRNIGREREARHPAPGDARPRGGAPEFVAFLAPTAEVQPVAPGERLFAPLASTRLRVLIPAAELAHRLRVLIVPLARFLADPSLGELGSPRAIVVVKLPAGAIPAMQAELSAMLDSIADGRCPAPAFADLADDYAAFAGPLHAPFLAEYQRRLAELCTLVVPCTALRDAVAPLARRGVAIVEDPYESDAAAPVRTRPRADGAVALCWFGNLGPPNAPGLRDALAALARDAGPRACRLELVAGEPSRPLVGEIAQAVAGANPAWSVAYSAWSPAAAAAAIERSDFVLLPQEHATGWGRVKSHNRLVETIRGGRLALASPIPSYLELADYAWVGDSLGEGLRWALAHPDEAATRVARGQAYVAERFAPAAIGAEWARVLGV
jgi:hypothetical protein